ncbi:hypothetical protein NC653_032174 [Populus alba x Populus x berolinensis]|uniref:Uncharacterized protein n=1 Tax=Populus alba x Populus x berolinensis TaxID=444605 RepID=A0AAD6LR82_9ROSI|nr:hypothetical protein NC653_032174 [Populus alba x Populus x berolinensis]
MTYKSSNISPPKYTKSRSGFLALEGGAASQALLRRSQQLDGPLKYLELASQELRSWIPNLPSVWKPSWDNQEVWTDVL